MVGCGSVAELESFFSHLGPAAERAGLVINENKCEIWGPGVMIPDESPLCKIPVAEWNEGITLLGSPIGSDNFSVRAAAKSLSRLHNALSKLSHLNKPRAAYLILRYSLGACRIIHLLRTCSISVCSALADDVHKLIYDALSDLIGTSMDDCHVTLSSLPLKMGGIGISNPCYILGPAGIASRIKSAVANVVQLPYPTLDDEFGNFLASPLFDKFAVLSDIRKWWSTCDRASANAGNVPENKQWDSQHHLFSLVMAAVAQEFDDSVNLRMRVWRSLFTGPCSNAWLNIHQLLSQSSLFDPDLSDRFFTLLKWRLALPLCSDNFLPTPCPGCGAQQDFFGDHALSCASMGRYARHNRLRNFFEDLFNEAGFATQIEAQIPTSTLRPADILVDGFSGDFPTAFDVTVSHALRPSISLAGVECGKSAALAAESKIASYTSACDACHWHFCPLAMETSGFVTKEVNSLVAKLCHRLSRGGNDSAGSVARRVWAGLALALFSSVGSQLATAYARGADELQTIVESADAAT